MARTKNINMPVGRPPKVQEIERVKKCHEMGMSVREISRAFDIDVSLVHRWIHYNPNKLAIFKQSDLSTVKL
jgi:DNA invertase Pin-like site-specific DNA recombinase